MTGADHSLGSVDPIRPVTLAVVLTFTMTMATFSQFVVGTLAPFLTAEFNMTRAQLGGLVTGSFLVAALTSPTAGVVVDRIRSHYALVALFGVVGLMYSAASAALSYIWLLLLLSLGGFAQALTNPITNKVIANLVPTHRRGVLIGVKQSGVQFGALLAGLILPTVAARYGWRVAVMGVGVVALLAGGVAILGGSPLSATSSDLQARRTRPRRLSVEVRSLIGYAFLMGGGVASATVHLPMYAHERLGFTPAVAGLTIAIAGFVAIFARIAWGRASDKVEDLWGMLGGLGLSAIIGTLFVILATLWGHAIWIAVVLLGVSAMAWNALAMIAAVRAAGPASAGWVSGVVNAGFFGGFVISPVVFGALVDFSENYFVAWLLLMVIYGCAAFLSLRRRGVSSGRSLTAHQ